MLKADLKTQINKEWTPDQVAECCDVNPKLRKRLWELVQDQRQGEWPEYPICTYSWIWSLTELEFEEVVLATGHGDDLRGLKGDY